MLKIKKKITSWEFYYWKISFEIKEMRWMRGRADALKTIRRFF